jgi:dipeptidyl aminopeptidase/acylaminoacyl peptidase
MKFIFLFLVFIGSAIAVIPQSVLHTSKENSQPTQHDRWDLSKYIWSQTHSGANKGNKQNVDFEAIDNWTEIGNDGNLAISNDGKYFAYRVENKSTQTGEILMLQSTDNSWRKECTTTGTGFFSNDCKQYIYQDKDSLCFVLLGGNQCRYVKEITSTRNIDNGKWLAWQLKNNKNIMVLLNLSTGYQMQFDSIADFTVNPKGNALVLRTVNAVIRYLNLETGMVKDIWSSTSKDITTSGYNFDTSGKQLVFLGQGKQQQNAVWYYKIGMEKAVVKLDNQALFLRRAEFTDDGRYIKLTLQDQPVIRLLESNVVNVDIYSYQDTLLQLNQISQLNNPKVFLGLFNLENSQLIRLENQYEKVKALSGDFAIVGKIGSQLNGDRFWEPNYYQDSNYLVSIKDGTRKLLKTKVTGSTGFWFSPNGNYLVYFDPKLQCNYFSYDLHTGKVVNISHGIPDWQLGLQNFYQVLTEKPNETAGVIGWMQDNGGILVYDNYDIWLLDVTGKKAPVNITNGYGRSHQVNFGLEEGVGINHLSNPVFTEHQSLLLRAFDRKSKYNGFFRKQLGIGGPPELIYMGPCIISGNVADIRGMTPVKASNASIWIVKRQSTNEAPNYFLTNDFKKYTRLTDIQPQQRYNWLTAELHQYKHLNGTIGQGVLYKPENFDPAKKYPVLIVFYRDFADRLYEFRTPKYNWSAIAPGDSPILFLNSGYLVFTPDMHVMPLKFGPSAFNVVEGAAKYLQQLPYVDGKHIGGAAHSWSAKLGTYIFTHSHTLSAMAISEGFLYANLINTALSINENTGQSNLETVEKSFEFGNLWENKSAWLDQTEVLHVDKASCPLLLYCNTQSLKDYQNQTMQLFLALRRLAKPCWWLKYEKSGHTLEGDEAKDYTLRYIQFFDHYLKGAPAPRWMSQGIPAALKGIESGYELDPTGNCTRKSLNKCAVCEKWNGQYKEPPERYIKRINEGPSNRD